ncbi:hypothetical protein [Streptococcus sp. DD13]|uniref:hypothetical protein n=1 Tax=Streptococcus sp. DD13 TaxID=1777881 RepID=UPI0007967762|nr:hypothetical protein [Streptococcus sp. DD13]KXT78417.1 hypothetical protein STRDD13_00720 [Streptococcus sp. DD13]
MVITDENYNEIADGVYRVDSGKTTHSWKKGKTFESGGHTFQVITTEDNPQNVMQATVKKAHTLICFYAIL